MTSAAPVHLHLSGRLRVQSSAGADITPKGAKTQALLGLLGTSPDLFRNRRWLEDKLWSDRCADQASASLRQALADIRRSFGSDQMVLVADRQKVGLRRDSVLVELSQTGEPEFLEGIDVRDPEFENWLRNERHRQLSQGPLAADVPRAVSAPGLAAIPLPTVRRAERRAYSVVLEKSRAVADGLVLVEDLFIDAVALSLREALGIPVFLRRQTPDLPNTILVSVQAIAATGGQRFIRARAIDAETQQVLWSGTSAGLAGTQTPEDLGVILFANQVVEVLSDAISLQGDDGPNLDALVLQRLAVRKLWTMDPDRLIEADVLLSLADDMAPRGLNAARRAQIRVLQMVERHAGDQKSLHDQAVALCRQALEREPNNSMVLAVASYVRCATDATPLHGTDLAMRSVRMNANNPLAWDSLSYAKLFAGHLTEAHDIALKVQKMGSTSPNRFWWDMGLCLTAAVSGDQALALRMAQSAHAGAPDFRAALRYIVALGAGQGRTDEALSAARHLSQVESGFKIEALALDPAYPVGVLRRSGLLQSDRILAISG